MNKSKEDWKQELQGLKYYQWRHMVEEMSNKYHDQYGSKWHTYLKKNNKFKALFELMKSRKGV